MEAIRNYKRALDLNPNLYITQFSLGLAYKDKGDYENALKTLKAFIKVAPPHFKSLVEESRKIVDTIEEAYRESEAEKSN